MADCRGSPTLTLFQTVVSTTIITTSTVAPQTQPDGSVSTVTLPLIITSLITLVNPTSTLYASCSSSSAIITTTQTSYPQPSPTVTTVTITSTPLPFPVTTLQTSTLNNGATTVFTITSTSTPPVSTITSINVSSQSSKSSSNIGPIVGGAAGGFIFLLAAVFLSWLIWKKCRTSGAVKGEDEVVFPYPVTRDRDQGRRLDLTRETRPYESDRGSTQIGGPGRLPAQSFDGWRDSSAGLIGTAGVPMASTSGPLVTANDAPNTERRGSQNSHRLPAGAAVPQDHYSHSGGSVSASSSVGPTSPNWRPLHVINSPPSPKPTLPGPSSGAVPGSSSGYDLEQQSAWPEKGHTRGASSSSGTILSNDGPFQGRDPRASVSLPAGHDPVTEEPADAPPAYVA